MKIMETPAISSYLLLLEISPCKSTTKSLLTSPKAQDYGPGESRFLKTCYILKMWGEENKFIHLYSL